MLSKKFILDTDIGNDSDDIGALAILCNLARQGKLQIAAVTVCNCQDDCAMAVDIIANCYNQTFPIGKAKNYGASAQYGTYARAICSAFPSRLKRGEIDDAVRVLRKTLAQNQHVSLITIGPLTNVAALAQSVADDVSPLSGKELLQRVDEMYVMGGNFVDGCAEWNVKEDVSAAQTALAAVDCPITFVPFEAGANVFTGKNFLCGKRSPMQVGYFVHNVVPRNSWDPLTVYCATVQCLETSETGVVQIDDDGVTTFLQNENGKHRFVKNTFDVEDIRQKLEDLMVD